MSKRRDFKEWAIELVYRKQEGACIKCGKPLGSRFERHHKDGDPANNSVENLELHCASCHGGEKYKTLIKKKKGALKDVEGAIQLSLSGKLSGAAADKLLDAIKLGLSLSEQIYGGDLDKIPVAIRMENYLVSSGLLLKEYERGFREGMLHASEAVASQLVKLMVANRESALLMQLLSKKVKGKKK